MQIGNEIFTLENIHWVGLLFLLLVLGSWSILLAAIIKKSAGFMLLSALTILPVALYFLVGAENWFRLVIFIPLAQMIFAIVLRIRPTR
ncbi:hypothetical protein [Bacillus sp. T33-2]|uniref:hypothetical protein n=1 Tax=Bacillus sp. T33-2 TaxID=2054168 RepID=UPI000C7678C4|nr:hypothetical protein [Bacillus sp. T33-2]PLR94172.1 hypothetical protein CVD19_17995 [Bacillus sp. T33-2]